MFLVGAKSRRIGHHPADPVGELIRGLRGERPHDGVLGVSERRPGSDGDGCVIDVPARAPRWFVEVWRLAKQHHVGQTRCSPDSMCTGGSSVVSVINDARTASSLTLMIQTG